jgi:hypothetical protein
VAEVQQHLPLPVRKRQLERKPLKRANVYCSVSWPPVTSGRTSSAPSARFWLNYGEGAVQQVHHHQARKEINHFRAHLPQPPRSGAANEPYLKLVVLLLLLLLPPSINRLVSLFLRPRVQRQALVHVYGVQTEGARPITGLLKKHWVLVLFLVTVSWNVVLVLVIVGPVIAAPTATAATSAAAVAAASTAASGSRGGARTTTTTATATAAAGASLVWIWEGCFNAEAVVEEK